MVHYSAAIDTAPRVSGSRRRTGSGWPMCRRLFVFTGGEGAGQRVPGGPCNARRVSPSPGGSGPSGGVSPGALIVRPRGRSPADNIVPARGLPRGAARPAQDSDQPTVEVERPHFWFFYSSLLSGQYRLLMGQKRHSLTLGAFLAPVLDLKLPLRLAVISLNIRFGLEAGMVIPASSP